MIFKRLKKPNPDAEKKLREEIDEAGGLEPKDIPAMILSALLTIVPVALGVLLLFCLVAWLFLS